MRDAAKEFDAIIARMVEHGFVLMMDFDGTLSPIVEDHPAARLSEKNRAILERLSRIAPIAIVSGRSLEDVRSRIRIPRLSYAGSHGLEVKMARPHARVRVPIPKTLMRKFSDARRRLLAVAKKYPSVSIEDKRTSFALHYRRLAPDERERFLQEASDAVARLREEGSVRVINDLSAFDIMPRSGRTKGACVTQMYELLRKRPDAVPVYVGDSETDEDAFRALSGGITIRVGKKRGSSADYYLAERDGVDRLLARLARRLSPADRGRRA